MCTFEEAHKLISNRFLLPLLCRSVHTVPVSPFARSRQGNVPVWSRDRGARARRRQAETGCVPLPQFRWANGRRKVSPQLCKNRNSQHPRDKDEEGSLCRGSVQQGTHRNLLNKEEEEKEDSRERIEDIGRHEHLLLKEIREMAVPSQPAVRLRFR